jgi:hypothetical protein
MRRVVIALAIAVGAGALFIGSIFAVSELGGEVVTLATVAADGSPVQTHLWIVDADGSSWLRAGEPGSGWLARIRSDPHVLVTRQGARQAYRAVPVADPAAVDRVNHLMRVKYGAADRFVSMLRDGSKSVPVRLDPESGH